MGKPARARCALCRKPCPSGGGDDDATAVVLHDGCYRRASRRARVGRFTGPLAFVEPTAPVPAATAAEVTP